MLKSKIEDFIGENKDDSFPDFLTLDKDEVKRHNNVIRESFGCPHNMLIIDVYNKIIEKSVLVQKVNAEVDDINFFELLESQNIVSKKNIYIDWHQLDEIDKMELDSLTKYFDSIWYPGADDIYIYDDTFSWFLFISHYGAVSITKK